MKHRITAGSSKPALGCPQKNRKQRLHEKLEPLCPAASRQPRGGSSPGVS